MTTTMARKFCLAICALALTACASTPAPKNIEPIGIGDGYQAQYRDPGQVSTQSSVLRSELINAQKCRPPIGGDRDGKGSKWGPSFPRHLFEERLTRNDLVRVDVDGDEVLSGSYVISRDGFLKLPFAKPVRAQGRSTDQIERGLIRALLATDLYEIEPNVSVRVLDFASVKVGVSGSVFEPHAVQIGGVSGDEVDSARQDAMGSSTEGRNLAVALRAAGGVRPDADLSAIELHRDGHIHRLDLRGVFEGTDPADIMLLTGDKIVVPSRLCFQDDLMRPSPISPPGVNMFLSNLTVPADSNSESAVGRDVRQMPYGTRYIQAVVDTNCYGGTKLTNANRRVVLVSRNPMTEVSVVIERDIEQLLRRKDRDDYDPYVLPGDAIACYDSRTTNVADVARIFGVVVTGGLLLRE